MSLKASLNHSELQEVDPERLSTSTMASVSSILRPSRTWRMSHSSCRVPRSVCSWVWVSSSPMEKSCRPTSRVWMKLHWYLWNRSSVCWGARRRTEKRILKKERRAEKQWAVQRKADWPLSLRSSSLYLHSQSIQISSLLFTAIDESESLPHLFWCKCNQRQSLSSS